MAAHNTSTGSIITQHDLGDAPMFADAAAGAVFVGVLKKQGRRTKRWVERNYVLRQLGAHGVLYYFDTGSDTAVARERINIDKSTNVIPRHEEDKHGFLIINPDREHLLFASSKKDSSMWISALESMASGVAVLQRTGSVNSRKVSSAPTVKEPTARRARSIDKYYEVHEELGSGGFATVRRGINRETKQEVALKVIPKATYRKAKARTDEEIMVLSACDHVHVMRMYEVVHTESSLVMVLELLTGGELFDRIVAREKYTENDAKQVATALLEAVNYLHMHGIVHRDLKPENLIFDRPGDDATLKLTDFGFATIMEPSKKLSSACGTPEYVAPEVLADKPYDQQADMWSCGVIIYILLCGYPPFFGKTEAELFQKILNRQFQFHDRFWHKISPEAKNLIEGLIELNPMKRLTSKQALQHPWIQYQQDSNVADENMSDALIQLKRFTAARKFRRGVMAVMAANRLTDLHAMWSQDCMS